MATSTLPDLGTPAQRRRFARLFSARVATDEQLSQAFSGAAGLGAITQQEYAWWEQALTGAHYHGRPLYSANGLLHCADLFGHWCHLLKTTLHEYFRGTQATDAQAHVLNFATMLTHQRLIWEEHFAADPTYRASPFQVAA